MVRRCLVVLLLAVAVVYPAAARVLYVNARADGPNHDGSSWANAFLAIQPALDAAQAGDEVWVAEGTYNDCLTVSRTVSILGGFTGTEATSERVQPWDHPTVIDAQRQGRVITIEPGATAATLDGLTITGGLSTDSLTTAKGGGVLCVGGTLEVSRCIVTGNEVFADVEYWSEARGGGICCQQAALSITRSIVSDNIARSVPRALQAWPTGAYAYGGGVYAANCFLTMANNVICRNRCAVEWGLYNWPLGSGVSVSFCNGAIANNTVTGNGRSEASLPPYDPKYIFGAVFLDVVNSGLAVTNNVIAENTGGVDLHSNLISFSNNLVSGNGTDYGRLNPTGTSGNISVDPLFVDAAAGNWRLRAASPCIDAGGPPTFGATDLAGFSRVMGEKVDMGAYESGWYAVTDIDKLKQVLRIAAGLESGGDTRPATLEDAVILARQLAGL